MRVPAVLLALAALPAAAQDDDWRTDRGPSWGVRADLDGDGTPESYLLEDNGKGGVDLWMEAGGTQAGFPGVAWLGTAAGQEPWLEVTEAGSLRIVSLNEGIGRHRWELALTVAHREGAPRVAGFTYTWRDTLDLDAFGVCDINLLTGEGVLETAKGVRAVRAPFAAPLLGDWREADMARLLAPCDVP